MYTTCPKCGHTRRPDEPADTDRCPGCGLIFSKWMKNQYRAAHIEEDRDEGGDDGLMRRIAHSFLDAPSDIDRMRYSGQLVIFVGFLIWGLYFISLERSTNAIGASFMHHINLVFHEAGHVLFAPLGQFMTILGGSLMQLIMPLVIVFAFVFKKQDPFAASIGLWWLGQSAKDLAPYIDDADTLGLVLLGGVTGDEAAGRHDWRNMLIDLRMLHRDDEIAQVFDSVGTLIILLALIWGAVILVKQYRYLR